MHILYYVSFIIQLAYFLYKNFKIMTIEFHVITILIYLNFHMHNFFLYGIQFIFMDLKYGFR